MKRVYRILYVSFPLIMIFNPEISIDDTCLKINREKC